MYVSFYHDMRIPQNIMIALGNGKPWFTRILKIKLKQKDKAFKSGDRALFKKPNMMSKERQLTTGAGLKVSSVQMISALSAGFPVRYWLQAKYFQP